MQGTVEGEGVWRITAVQGFSCYQCLCVYPQGNRGGKAVVSAPRGPAAYGTDKIEATSSGETRLLPKISTCWQLKWPVFCRGPAKLSSWKHKVSRAIFILQEDF